jgi:hypothetical protein
MPRLWVGHAHAPSMIDPRAQARHRLLAILAGAAILAVAGACSSEGDADGGTWTLGPTLAPASGAPASGAPAESAVPASAGPAPSGSVPVGSGAPVASIGPDTSSAPQPSVAP